ncbi:hypothetical protein ACXN5S_12500 [Pseudoroseicyclus sp. H15]
MADTKHSFDPITGWCLRCGQARHAIADGEISYLCDAGPTVVAISHQVRGQMFAVAAERMTRRT